MSYTKYLLSVLFVIGAVYIVGCTYKKTDPEPAAASARDDWPANENFDAQANNAVLTSMTVADIHFVPYRPHLNSLGRARLTAIASYLEQYGGRVTIDIRQAEPAVQQQR